MILTDAERAEEVKAGIVKNIKPNVSQVSGNETIKCITTKEVHDNIQTFP